LLFGFLPVVSTTVSVQPPQATLVDFGNYRSRLDADRGFNRQLFARLFLRHGSSTLFNRPSNDRETPGVANFIRA
jgi:hypothetical protein